LVNLHLTHLQWWWWQQQDRWPISVSCSMLHTSGKKNEHITRVR